MVLTSPHLRTACSWQKVGETVFGDDGKLAEVITPTVNYRDRNPSTTTYRPRAARIVLGSDTGLGAHRGLSNQAATEHTA
jgi:hypothetical protein